jgi:hypothetical protein
MEQKQLRIGVRRWNRSFTGVSGVPLGRLTLSPKVAAEVAYKNAKENTPHNARMAHDQAPGQGDAASLEGRHAGLQAVRGERVVDADNKGNCDSDHRHHDIA